MIARRLCGAAYDGERTIGGTVAMRCALMGVGVAVACAFGFAGIAAAGPANGAGLAQVFVSAPGGSNCGGGRAYTTIGEALANVAPSGTVHVCPGTYSEDVVITQPVTLQGANATVQPDASDTSPVSDLVGGNNAFTVLAGNVTIRGFTVQGATSDGIFVVGDHALIENVHAINNAVNGINLDGSSWSVVRENTLNGNGSGIELANDPVAAGIPPDVLAQFGSSTGTATHDLVADNRVVENPFACGILLVDHAGASDALGIHDNQIEGNLVANNAMQGFGAGVLLASPAPGGAVYDNLISGNTIYGNGLSGVTVHSHVPGQNLNGNVVTYNVIGTNNLRGATQEPDDPQTTGVFIGSQSPLSITVSGNTISNDYYGIFTAGSSVTVMGATSNTFNNVTIPISSSATFE
jgi:hypothetical protein